MKLRTLDDDEPAINLTPMIDVVFTLLVFFMLATTFAERERMLDVELPYASAGGSREAEPQELVINVSQEGSVWVDGRSVPDERLEAVLGDVAQRRSDTRVTIRGDRRGYYDKIVHVLDLCMRAGLQDVSLGTLEKD